jgi:type VI secretion system secreted protein VgrG
MARPITMDVGSLRPETLLFRRMSGIEELGRPFSYDLELLSADETISFTSVVGQLLAVHLAIPDSSERHFHGLVTRFTHVGWSGTRAVYGATLRPSLWLLTHRAGCRIFQDRTVPEILQEVLAEYGFPFDLELASSDSYPKREYVVQYRETDFNFVSRLMEQEGIYYYFRHEAGKHTMVLADSLGAHSTLEGYEEIPFYPPQEGQRWERDHIEDWQVSHEIEPTAFSLRDHDFTRPQADLEVKRSGEGAWSPELEIYDYPGRYVRAGQDHPEDLPLKDIKGDGDRYARTRLEELVARQERGEGSTDAMGISAGLLFTMKNHPRQEQNREYLVLAATYRLALPDQESYALTSSERVFECRFSAQASRTPFRPVRSTPKPVVQGPQTARVVGKAGEEIWTDNHGRVKVEFPWDRASPGNERSSCWVRVAQAWAGAGWGAMYIPRIGQEVLVDFLEGDPDQPIITGRVYNGDNPPPYALPANKTKSTIKSNSTPGGNGANELRFEDAAGEEEVYLHAQKDWNILVNNDKSQEVDANEKLQVKGNRDRDVGGNQTMHVVKDDTNNVDGSQSVAIGKDQGMTVGGARSADITGSDSLTVGKSLTLDVKDTMQASIGKDYSEEIGGKKVENVSDAATLDVGKNYTITVGGNLQTKGSQNIQVSADNDFALTAKKITLNGENGIVLKAGDATIELKQNGDITIKGKNLKLTADSDVVIKGSKVTQN